ncbi:hypothetical protein CFIMG_006731RA [Ceratocystis fimbriata CBS 114723]|uniref:Uncharacterized protein n=1 Tax=Ceratocystis fimbriata CBS 114723 TaxID=1035309 RepID=A0A2C5WWB6_9PEZI|nr:hypothetical protein CFIMG_006731RA [Ceratocystis fimbriata CBS 114723]
MSFARVSSFSPLSSPSAPSFDDAFANVLNTQNSLTYDAAFEEEFLAAPLVSEQSSTIGSLEGSDLEDLPIDPSLLALVDLEGNQATSAEPLPSFAPLLPVSNGPGFGLGIRSEYVSLEAVIAFNDSMQGLEASSSSRGMMHEPMFGPGRHTALVGDIPAKMAVPATDMGEVLADSGIFVGTANHQASEGSTFQPHFLWNGDTSLAHTSYQSPRSDFGPEPAASNLELMHEHQNGGLQASPTIYPALDSQQTTSACCSEPDGQFSFVPVMFPPPPTAESSPSTTPPRTSSASCARKARSGARGRMHAANTARACGSPAASLAPTASPSPSPSVANGQTPTNGALRRSKISDPSVQAFYAVTGNSKKDQVAPSTRKETPEVMNQLARNKTRNMTRTLAQKAVENAARSRVAAEMRVAEAEVSKGEEENTEKNVSILTLSCFEGSKISGGEMSFNNGKELSEIHDLEIDLLALKREAWTSQFPKDETNSEPDESIFHAPENPYMAMTEGDATIRSATQTIAGLSSWEGPVAFAANQPKADPRRTKLEINTERAMESSFEDHGLRLDRSQDFPRLGTPLSFVKLEEDNGHALHREAQQDVVERRREQRARGNRYWARGANRGTNASSTPASSGQVTPVPFENHTPLSLSPLPPATPLAFVEEAFPVPAAGLSSASDSASSSAFSKTNRLDPSKPHKSKPGLSPMVLKFLELEDDDWMVQFVKEIRKGRPVQNYGVEWQEWEEVMFPQANTVKPPRKPRLSTQLKEAQQQQEQQKQQEKPKKTRAAKAPKAPWGNSRKRRGGSQLGASGRSKRTRLSEDSGEKEDHEMTDEGSQGLLQAPTPIDPALMMVEMDFSSPPAAKSSPQGRKSRGQNKGGRGSRGGRRGRGRGRGRGATTAAAF